MGLENDDVKNLQKLIKSSLLEINKLKLELVKVKDENANLKNSTELDDLKLKYAEDLKNKEEEINNLKAEFDASLESKDSEISNLKAEFDASLESKDSEINSLKAEFDASLESKDSEITALNSNLNSTVEKFAAAESIIKSKDEIIAAKKDEIENLSTTNDNLKHLNASLLKMKDSLEADFNNFKNLELEEVNAKLKNALNDVSDKENKIQSLSNDLKIAENDNASLKREFEDFKTNASSTEVKLAAALNSVEEKNAEISKLNLKIDNQTTLISELKSNLVNKDSLTALQRELDSKDLAIKEKEVQIKVLKDKSVSKEQYDSIQNELSKKDLQIKRLNEVKDLFFELSDKEPIVSTLDDEIINQASDDDNYLLTLNELKKELETAKEDNVKFTLSSADEDSEYVEGLKDEIEKYKESVSELEKIKDIYTKLTSPQLTNLTSIQSQVYYLMPDEPMDTLAIKNYLNEIAFSSLSFGNTKNILKSLEKKGYVESEVNDKDITFWKKIDVE